MFGLNEALMSFIRRQVGLRTDSADASGSLHAKVNSIVGKNIINYGSAIKSIQRGVVLLTYEETSKTVTISSVNTNKTMLNFLGAHANSLDRRIGELVAVAYTGHHFVTLQLTSSTQITVTRSEKHTNITVSYEVIEYY